MKMVPAGRRRAHVSDLYSFDPDPYPAVALSESSSAALSLLNLLEVV